VTRNRCINFRARFGPVNGDLNELVEGIQRKLWRENHFFVLRQNGWEGNALAVFNILTPRDT